MSKMTARHTATAITPIGVGATIFAIAAFVQSPDDWIRFGYYWADQHIFGIVCAAWAIIAFRLRWNQQERPELWSAFLLISAVAYGGFAVAFGFQGSATGIKWATTCALFCYEANDLHGVISRLKRGDDLSPTPRSTHLQKFSELWLVAVVALGLVLFAQSSIPLPSLASGLSLLAGVGTAATKMFDTFVKIKGSIASSPSGDAIVIPVSLQAFSEVNASLQSELEFKSQEIQRLRDTIARIRARLPDEENTQL